MTQHAQRPAANGHGRATGRFDLGPTGELRPVAWTDRPESGDADSFLARAMAINEVAEDLAGEFMLRPLLERILQRSAELMGCDAGSISSVDEAVGTYRKEADIGIRCRSGQEFPLSEGMTGEVVRRRGPVWVDRYESVTGGHISAEERATLKSVIGVPLEWRGRIIGACVLFTRDPDRRFDEEDAQLLSMFARHAALALANAKTYEAAEEKAQASAAVAERNRVLREIQDQLGQGVVGLLSHLARADKAVDTPGGVREAVSDARSVTNAMATSIRHTLLGLAVSPLEGRSLEDALRAELDWATSVRAMDARLVVAGTRVVIDHRLAHEALRISQEAIANVVRHANASRVRVGLVYGSTALSLLVQDDGQGFDRGESGDVDGLGLRRISERALGVGGSVTIDSVPGWGTSVRASLPYLRPKERARSLIEVVLVDPYPSTRAGMARLLSWSDPAISVVMEVAGVSEACASMTASGADVVVLGPHIPAPPARAVERLRHGLDVAVVVVASDLDPSTVTAALDAGASACVDAASDGGQLADAVLAVARGQAVVAPSVRSESRESARDNGVRLTSREREVRALVEKGLTDKAIAERLVISVKTVEKHVSAVLHKTHHRSRVELVAELRKR